MQERFCRGIDATQSRQELARTSSECWPQTAHLARPEASARHSAPSAMETESDSTRPGRSLVHAAADDLAQGVTGFSPSVLEALRDLADQLVKNGV